MWYCRNESCDENGIGKEGHGPDVLGDITMTCGNCGQACEWSSAPEPEAKEV